MAQRRMFSKTITSSARFLKMPQEAQNLYFHLCMNADDDGVVEAFTIMQMLGSSEDVIKNLVGRNFVIPLNLDLVTYILDWNEHNQIRPDRKVNSIYKDLLVKVLPEVEIVEPKPRADTGVIPRQTTGRPLDRIGEVSIGKVSIGEKYPLSWLKDLTKDDAQEFVDKFNCDSQQVKAKADSLLDYCKSKGKVYKDYRAFLSNALRKDFGERPQKEKVPIYDTSSGVAKIIGYK